MPNLVSIVHPNSKQLCAEKQPITEVIS